MKQTFYSNGKLLITGEYVVLDGAIALALPTKFGQYLEVEKNNSNKIVWKSFDADKSSWFETSFTIEDVKNKINSEDKVKSTLIEILHEANILNSEILENSTGFNIETKLTFPRNWGLGTSSTLINNIAQWFEIDAFELLNKSFGGSGYDIACAQNNFPILYQLQNQKPVVTKINFDPNFKENIYFVYLNQKQNSRQAIANYHNKRGEVQSIIESINEITKIVTNTNEVSVFEKALQKHEIEMSFVLEQMTIKELLFSDFDGTIKSLGAWGGDFVMAISEQNPRGYFASKGFKTVLKYSEMIL